MLKVEHVAEMEQRKTIRTCACQLASLNPRQAPQGGEVRYLPPAPICLD